MNFVRNHVPVDLLATSPARYHCTTDAPTPYEKYENSHRNVLRITVAYLVTHGDLELCNVLLGK